MADPALRRLTMLSHQVVHPPSHFASRRDDDVLVLSVARTPICKARRGAFRETTPDVLLASVLAAAVERSGVPREAVGEIRVGNVLPANGAVFARMAQFQAGFPYTVPIATVNRQCSSGLQAVADVAAAIRAGTYEIGIGAGVESMSSTPMDGAIPPFDQDAVSSCPLAADCLTPMGITSEQVAAEYGISRVDQDKFAARSHALAARAQAAGRFNAEIVPVTLPDGVVVSRDEGIRPTTTPESLAKLKYGASAACTSTRRERGTHEAFPASTLPLPRPAFQEGGTTTAGNSSQVSDGASAVLLASRRAADRLGLSTKALGIFRAYAVAGVPPATMGIGPAVAIPAALDRAHLQRDDIGIFEINEAFASQAVYCARALAIPDAKLNPNGGAIALGHPLGCTGARQVATLLNEMHRSRQRFGVVSMCIGTGMGAAAVFEALSS